MLVCICVCVCVCARQALEVDPFAHIMYSNRSAAYLSKVGACGEECFRLCVSVCVCVCCEGEECCVCVCREMSQTP